MGQYSIIIGNELTVHYLQPGAHKLNYCNNLLPFIIMTSKESHENGLITRKCVAIHTNILSFEMAIYSSVLVMKLFNNNRKFS